MHSRDLIAAVRQLHDAGSDLTKMAHALGMKRGSILTALRRADAHELLIQVRRPPAHGTSGYKRGCRCDTCTTANTVRVVAARTRRTGQTPSRHGASGYTNHNCRCDICVAGHSELKRQRAAIGRDVAANHRKEWTGPELELITQTSGGRRYRRTSAECALILGRSTAAVNVMRAKCAREPKYVALAGQRSA